MEAHTGVSSEVQTSSEYKEIQLSLYKAVEAHKFVPCEVQTSSTYKKVKLSS
jgi:hypothetical protein